MKKTACVLFAFILLAVCGCSAQPSPAITPALSPSPSAVQTAVPSAETGTLTIEAIDVGHGDAILITGKNGSTMLIDTGESDAKKQLSSALTEAGVTKIDILLLTHPHSDHIGNAAWVLKHYDVGAVHMAERTNTTDIYFDLLDELEKAERPVIAAKKGYSFEFDGAQCQYIGPLKDDYKDINDSSAVLMMTFAGKKLLFMGDAETTCEQDYIDEYGAQLDADFLKVGHHANSSTSQEFVDAVTPQVAVVSMKDLSSYSRPEKKQAVIDRLISAGAAVYRTDTDGNVTVTLSADGFSVTTEK